MPVLQLTQGNTLHYLDYHRDASPVVLLLHGLGATCESWLLQIPALTGGGFRILAPDARGFGKSTYPGGGTTIAEMAGDMARLLEHLETGPAYVVGISMGGTLALQLALDFPVLVDRLVLVNTFACLRPERLSIWLNFALRFVLVHTLGLQIQARTVARRIFPRSDQELLRKVLFEQICQADPKGYSAAMRALARFNVLHRLGEIHVPTLVITGELDGTVSPKNQRILADRIPNARQEVIPGAGRRPCSHRRAA
jgi:pimeloyl-ACP methyl ester carboxylesterase